MQTFRAYLKDAAGVITWAAWVDAAHLDEAKIKAQALCGEATPTLELWSAADRRPGDGCRLEPV